MSQGLFTILFVDKTDTFRAQIAAALLRHELDTRGHQDVTIHSAGTEAKESEPISPHAVEVVPSLMADSTAPRANKVTLELIDKAHLILVMDSSQSERLLEDTPQAADCIRMLGRYDQKEHPEIPVAAGQSPGDLQKVFHQIECAVLGLLSQWDTVRGRFFVRQRLDVAVAADHRGFAIKKDVIAYLEKAGYRVLDCGAHSSQASDHPVFAIQVGEMVAREEVDRGILICGSGLGMSISANKVHGVRAAMCISPDHAALSRTHNNANILCLAAEYFPEEEEMEIIKIWMTTPFLGGKYQRRINMMSHYEDANRKDLPGNERPAMPDRD